jgi:hypothetical protein
MNVKFSLFVYFSVCVHSYFFPYLPHFLTPLHSPPIYISLSILFLFIFPVSSSSDSPAK